MVHRIEPEMPLRRDGLSVHVDKIADVLECVKGYPDRKDERDRKRGKLDPDDPEDGVYVLSHEVGILEERENPKVRCYPYDQPGLAPFALPLGDPDRRNIAYHR